MELSELRRRAGLTQAKMADKFEIPKRTIENWESGSRKCPRYVEKLIREKLEGIIMENAKVILAKAMEMDEYENVLPQVDVGDEVCLSEIWDGNGDAPDSSYSYQLTDSDWINYCFEIIEEKENPLATLVKITDIELL